MRIDQNRLVIILLYYSTAIRRTLLDILI
jgi:hypothetical protein